MGAAGAAGGGGAGCCRILCVRGLRAAAAMRACLLASLFVWGLEPRGTPHPLSLAPQPLPSLPWHAPTSSPVQAAPSSPEPRPAVLPCVPPVPARRSCRPWLPSTRTGPSVTSGWRAARPLPWSLTLAWGETLASYLCARHGLGVGALAQAGALWLSCPAPSSWLPAVLAALPLAHRCLPASPAAGSCPTLACLLDCPGSHTRQGPRLPALPLYSLLIIAPLPQPPSHAAAMDTPRWWPSTPPNPSTLPSRRPLRRPTSKTSWSQCAWWVGPGPWGVRGAQGSPAGAHWGCEHRFGHALGTSH